MCPYDSKYLLVSVMATAAMLMGCVCAIVQQLVPLFFFFCNSVCCCVHHIHSFISYKAQALHFDVTLTALQTAL